MSRQKASEDSSENVKFLCLTWLPSLIHCRHNRTQPGFWLPLSYIKNFTLFKNCPLNIKTSKPSSTYENEHQHPKIGRHGCRGGWVTGFCPPRAFLVSPLSPRPLLPH